METEEVNWKDEGQRDDETDRKAIMSSTRICIDQSSIFQCEVKRHILVEIRNEHADSQDTETINHTVSGR